jgi:enamine deaminase RidA (YjgF/YER057c/UK114 family)
MDGGFDTLMWLLWGALKAKPPARATVQVSRLPRDALVEISAIANQ